jgi:Domain of unknown function (DUF1824)
LLAFNMALSLQAAHDLLKAFDCLVPKAIDSETERQQVQQALLQVAHHSDYQILGICADTVEQGYQALQSYAAVLGYEPLGCDPIGDASRSIASPAEAVYLKFNPKAGSCYVAPYEGTHRGVLVACQSAHESGLNEIYGHLPADLFEND